MHAELIEDCEVCGGSIDTNQPGHYKSVDERFRHKVCHETGESPDGYVLNLAGDCGTKACMNRQYHCGHTAYGPPLDLPSDCPECGDN